MLNAIRDWFREFRDPWPNARPLPKHVADLRLDVGKLYLHMSAANKPSDRTYTGYAKPTTEKAA